MDKPHYHRDEQGFLVKCYHQSRSTLTSISFWIGVTVSYPIEHFIWEKLWPFVDFTRWIGL